MPRPVIPPAPAAEPAALSAPSSKIVLPSAALPALGELRKQYSGTGAEAVRCAKALLASLQHELNDLEKAERRKTQTAADIEHIDQLALLTTNVTHAAKSLALVFGPEMRERLDTHTPEPGRATSTPRYEISLAMVALEEETDLKKLNLAALQVSWACQMAIRWTLDGIIASSSSFAPATTR